MTIFVSFVHVFHALPLSDHMYRMYSRIDVAPTSFFGQNFLRIFLAFPLAPQVHTLQYQDLLQIVEFD